jgi:hypothetical protein
MGGDASMAPPLRGEEMPSRAPCASFPVSYPVFFQERPFTQPAQEFGRYFRYLREAATASKPRSGYAAPAVEKRREKTPPRVHRVRSSLFSIT